MNARRSQLHPRAAALLAALPWLLPSPAAAAEPAELVLVGGVVHTLDPRQPRAEALAIRGNRIVAVGSSAAARQAASPRARVIDLAGRTVVPGFDDSHAHVLGIGFGHLDVDLVGTRSFAEVVARIGEAVRSRRPGEWIRGRGWHEGKWTAPAPGSVRGFPTHAALSAVSPENPVVLVRADGHAVLANARAMALKGVGASTRPPAGGEIVRDARGNPTGVFVDDAKDLVEPPPRAAEEARRALELSQQECLEKGVTSITDAGASLETLALYREAAKAGRLRVRLYAMAEGLATMRALERPEIGLGGGMLTIRAAKLYADGALGSRGAALLAPYSDDPGNAGLLVTSPEVLLEAARFALARGFQVATHAIGDRGNRVVLDAYERALGEHPEASDPRFRIEHAQVLDLADIPRFARLGVIAAVQGVHCPSDRPWAGQRLGDARLAGAYAWRKLLASGARLSNGTDAPVEDVSPVMTFHATVTREDAAGQPPGGWDPAERLTRLEALRSMTLDAAFARFAERDAGSIEVGKLADLTVLSQDILAVPEDALTKTEVVATIVDGQVRWARAGSGLEP